MSTTTYPSSAGPGPDEHNADPVRARPRFRRILIVGGVLFIIALVVGFIPQLRQRQTATADTNQLAIPTFAVVSPTVTTPGSGLNLPAEVKPWQEASIYARVNGYLRRSEEHTSELQSQFHLVCRLLLEKKKNT